jgi:hypothetical protein
MSASRGRLYIPCCTTTGGWTGTSIIASVATMEGAAMGGEGGKGRETGGETIVDAMVGGVTKISEGATTVVRGSGVLDSAS